MLKEEILRELEAGRGHAISGQALADKNNVTRNSIWKAVNQLKKDGYNILSSTNRGYMLADDNDLLSKQGISLKLDSELVNIPIKLFQNIDSTNSEAKRMLADDDSIKNALIVSEGQNKGKSRHSLGFYSPMYTGIYMSLIYFVSDKIINPQFIAMKAGLAVIRAVDLITGIKLSVKNVNDIYYCGKKAGGILTEAVTGLETGLTSHVIVGIGINVSTDKFPETIDNNATSLSELNIYRNDLIAAIVNQIIPLYDDSNDDSFLVEYEKYMIK